MKFELRRSVVATENFNLWHFHILNIVIFNPVSGPGVLFILVEIKTSFYGEVLRRNGRASQRKSSCNLTITWTMLHSFNSEIIVTYCCWLVLLCWLFKSVTLLVTLVWLCSTKPKCIVLYSTITISGHHGFHCSSFKGAIHNNYHLKHRNVQKQNVKVKNSPRWLHAIEFCGPPAPEQVCRPAIQSLWADTSLSSCTAVELNN